MGRNRAVISVIGHDQKGIVARISTFLASCSINIEDIEQRVVEGLFIMTMVVDLSELSLNLDELILGLKKIGEEIHMEVTIRPRNMGTFRFSACCISSLRSLCMRKVLKP